MKLANSRVHAINVGPCSIKFALFEAEGSVRRILAGRIEQVGLPGAAFVVKGSTSTDNFAHPTPAPDHTAAVGVLTDWVQERSGRGTLAAVGHRVVQRGPKHSDPRRITRQSVAESPSREPFDSEPLPQEILP